MEVVSWDEIIEPEAEETEVSLRPRQPRHHSDTDDVVTASRDDNSDKSSQTYTDESRPSDDEEEKTTNGKPSNGDGNGDAKSTNGHSKLDERYVDFLVPEQNPTETVSKSEEIEAEESVLVAKPDNAVEIEVVDNASSSLQEVHTFPASNETVQYMEAELRKKIEAEFRELYLDKLSDRQGKHEFYCPNCKACITKVLVREAEVELSSEPSDATVEPARVVKRWFQCTSCFSFLTPIGNWLFPKWKAGEDEGESIFHQGRLHEPLLHQTSQSAISKTPVPKQPVVAKLTEKIETQSRDWTVSLGGRDIQDVLSKTLEPTLPSVTGVTATIEAMEHHAERITAFVGPAQSQPWASVAFGKKLQGAIKGRIPVTEEVIRVTAPAEPTKPSEEIDVVKEQAMVDDTFEDGKQHYHQLPVSELAGTVVSAEFTPLGTSVEAGVELEVSVPSQELKGNLPGLDQSRREVVIVRTKPSEIDVVVGSTGEVSLLQEVIIHHGPKPDATLEGIDAGLAGAVLSDSTAAVVLPRDTGIFTEQDSPKSWEVVKSLVYGGLVESITSLGIVTSAASGDASTLNIVALALANLIGGLFVIAHNIWELRDEQSTLQCSRTKRLVDKYHEVLGRRENFPLHATCVILSFLIFGLIPPVVYGLTFRASDDKDLKLLAVGVASLICITIMAVGKAYIQKPNKYIKTIFYYLVIGFGVAGASYLAGKLIKQLLEKISSSESTLALAVSLSGMGSAGGWGSY